MTKSESGTKTYRKTHGSGYRNGQMVVHYTKAPATAKYSDNIRPVCGQRSRHARYGIVADTATVNCEKCLAIAD